MIKFQVKIRTTRPAKYLPDIRNNRLVLRKLVKFFIRFLENHFESPLLLEIPENLQNTDPEIYAAITLAHELKRLGIINEIKKIPKIPDEPFFHGFIFARSSSAASVGADMLSDKKAIWKFLAEASERYLWKNSDAFYVGKIKKASSQELGNKAIDIFSLAGFSEEQKMRLKNLQFDKGTVFGWTKVRSIISGRNFFCPIQLLSAKYAQKKIRFSENSPKEEPMLRWSVTTGLATGRSLDEAIAKGVMETIERDAFMINYLNKISAPIVNLSTLQKQDPDIAKIVKSFERYNLEIKIVKMATDMPIYAFLAAIIDRSGLGPALTIGTSADFDPKQCILDALSEALCGRVIAKNSSSDNEPAPKKINREGRIRYWIRPENLPKIEFLFSGEEIDIGNKWNNNFYKNIENDRRALEAFYKKRLNFLSSRLEKNGYEAYYSEITSREVKKLGFRCVQLVIPKLQPMHLDESIPYLGGKRLKKVPEKLGYQPAETLFREPHPLP